MLQADRGQARAAPTERQRVSHGHRDYVVRERHVRRVRRAVAVRRHRTLRQSCVRAYCHVHHTRAW